MSITADLTALYRAGKVTLPASAGIVTSTVETLGTAHAAYQGQLPETDNAPSLADAVAMNAELYRLLHRAAETLADGAATLVAVADDLRRTDEVEAERGSELERLVTSPLDLPPLPPAEPGGHR